MTGYKLVLTENIYHEKNLYATAYSIQKICFNVYKNCSYFIMLAYCLFVYMGIQSLGPIC